MLFAINNYTIFYDANPELVLWECNLTPYLKGLLLKTI